MQIVDRCRNGPGFHGDGEGGASVQEMLIPASKVGLVIGRGGDTIKQLQVIDRTGDMPCGEAPDADVTRVSSFRREQESK